MEILNETVVSALGSNVIFVLLFFAVALATVIAFAIGFAMISEGEGGGFVALLIGGILVFFSTVMYDMASYEYTKYEVKIEDFNEVYEEGYEIIDQDGQIFTIVKKEEYNQ